MTFTETSIMQEPPVTLNGVKLTVNEDHIVFYEDNTNVGAATVIVAGRGSYAGSRYTNAEFQFEPIE